MKSLWDKKTKSEKFRYDFQLKPGRPLRKYVLHTLKILTADVCLQSSIIGGLCMGAALSQESDVCVVVTVSYLRLCDHGSGQIV